MQGTDDWSGTLASWSEFILFHVLPTAVAQIYDWIREWQILAAAVLVLIFFHFWTRAILRAARRVARETVQTETRTFGASLNLLRRQMEQKAPAPRSLAQVPRPVELQPAEPRAAEPHLVRPAPTDGYAAVERLRQAIRLALGTIPLSDEPLSPDGTRLYSAAIGAMANANVTPGVEAEGNFRQILSELAALEQSFPPQSCRQAWQALVKVNALAREFHEAAPARAATS